MDARKQLIQQLMQSQGGAQPGPDMGMGQQMPPQMPQQPPQAGQQGMGGAMISLDDLMSSGILSEEQIMQLAAKAGM
jgi:hypothetical protein